MDNSSGGSSISELADSMREVAAVWRRYNEAVQAPFAAESQAAKDLERQPALCASGVPALTNLVLSCNLSMVHASDQIAGIAACTEAPDVGWAMYSCARTATVATARAHYLASGRTTVERLRRQLNDDLGANASMRNMALHEHSELVRSCDAIEKKIRSDGVAAGLIWRDHSFEPYFAATKKQKPSTASPSETQKIRLIYAGERGMNDQMKAFSYRLLSAVVHDRTRSAGLAHETKIGEPRDGVQEVNMFTTPRKIARGTAMVVSMLELAGARTLQHCGVDDSAFRADVRAAARRWIEIAEVSA